MPLNNVERDVGPLVVAAQGGDDEAYGALVEAHWAELVRFARSVVGDQDAEDVVQRARDASGQAVEVIMTFTIRFALA